MSLALMAVLQSTYCLMIESFFSFLLSDTSSCVRATSGIKSFLQGVLALSYLSVFFIFHILCDIIFDF